MKSKKTQIPEWKIAGLYFFLTLIFITLLSAVYNLLVVRFGDEFPYYRYIIGTGIPFRIYHEVFSTLLYIVAIIAAATIVKKRVPIKNVPGVAKIATIFLAVTEVLFFMRDLLVRNIGGIPIYRNYELIFASSVVTVILFYFLTRHFLKK